jgi:hypothetical protein
MMSGEKSKVSVTSKDISPTHCERSSINFSELKWSALDVPILSSRFSSMFLQSPMLSSSSIGPHSVIGPFRCLFLPSRPNHMAHLWNSSPTAEEDTTQRGSREGWSRYNFMTSCREVPSIILENQSLIPGCNQLITQVYTAKCRTIDRSETGWIKGELDKLRISLWTKMEMHKIQFVFIVNLIRMKLMKMIQNQNNRMNKEPQHCMKSWLIEMMILQIGKIQCILIFIPSISFDPFLSFVMPKRLVWIMHTLTQTFRCSSALWRTVYWFIHSFDGWFLFARNLSQYALGAGESNT